jgi:hypothetical protein
MAPSQAGKQVVQRQPTVTTRLFLIAFTTAFVGQFAGAAPNLIFSIILQVSGCGLIVVRRFPHIRKPKIGTLILAVA